MRPGVHSLQGTVSGHTDTRVSDTRSTSQMPPFAHAVKLAQSPTVSVLWVLQQLCNGTAVHTELDALEGVSALHGADISTPQARIAVAHVLAVTHAHCLLPPRKLKLGCVDVHVAVHLHASRVFSETGLKAGDGGTLMQEGLLQEALLRNKTHHDSSVLPLLDCAVRQHDHAAIQVQQAASQPNVQQVLLRRARTIPLRSAGNTRIPARMRPWKRAGWG